MLLRAATFKVPVALRLPWGSVLRPRVSGKVVGECVFLLTIAPGCRRYRAWGRVVLMKWEDCFWRGGCL